MFSKGSSSLTWIPRLSTSTEYESRSTVGIKIFHKTSRFPKIYLSLGKALEMEEDTYKMGRNLATFSPFHAHFIFLIFSLQTNSFIHFSLLIFPRLVLFVIQSSFSTFFHNVCFIKATKGSCGNGVQISAGQADIKLDGKTFRNKPIDAVTIALWINVTSVKGAHYLFDTIGGHSAHKHDQYLLAINNGAVTWSHNDQNDRQLFKVTTDPIVTESKCMKLNTARDLFLS